MVKINRIFTRIFAYSAIFLLSSAFILSVHADPNAATSSCPAHEINMLIDLSHEFTFMYDTFGAGEYLKEDTFQKTNSHASLTSNDVKLQNYDVIVINQLDSNIEFSDKEIDLLEKWVRNGGGLLITGKGLQTYPLNELASRFGITFTTDPVVPPFKLTDHELNTDVGKFEINTGSIGTRLSVSGDGGYKPIVFDSQNGIVAVSKIFGSGFVIAVGEDEFIANPSQAEVVNHQFVFNLMKWLGKNRLAKGRCIPDRILPENKIMQEEITLYYSDKVKNVPSIQFIKENLLRINIEIEKITGIKNEFQMSFIVLAGAGGSGYSTGQEVGIGSKNTGPDMLGVLSHELAHSFDNPNPPPEMMHPVASLVSDRVGLAFGGEYAKAADLSFQNTHDNLKRIDPHGTSLDISRYNGDTSFVAEPGDVHEGRWGKMYWIVGSLEGTYKFDTSGMYHFPKSNKEPAKELLQRYFRLKRQDKNYQSTPENIVRLFSIAACKNLYQDFLNIGTTLIHYDNAAVDKEIGIHCSSGDPKVRGSQ